jgi:thiosulfate/3-mercaptopyruvate sulfurtransferase
MAGRQPFKRIAVSQAQHILSQDEPLVLDCRDASAFAKSHIDGARHLTSANQDGFVLGTRKSTPVLIYCYRGNASQEYAQTFQDFGFQSVYSLDGGYEAWLKAPAVGQPEIADPTVAAWMSGKGFDRPTLDATIEYGLTPLMKAALDGDLAMIDALLALGADTEARNPDGNTALWLASVGQSLPVIERLAEAGAKLDHQNDNGASCLMYSASSGRTTVVEKLLALGADVILETLDGFTALDMAANEGCLMLLRAAAKAKR